MLNDNLFKFIIHLAYKLKLKKSGFKPDLKDQIKNLSNNKLI